MKKITLVQLILWSSDLASTCASLLIQIQQHQVDIKEKSTNWEDDDKDVGDYNGDGDYVDDDDDDDDDEEEEEEEEEELKKKEELNGNKDNVQTGQDVSELTLKL